jgi:hypothetical protein
MADSHIILRNNTKESLAHEVLTNNRDNLCIVYTVFS